MPNYEEEETIRVCDHCHGEVAEQFCGDEGWSVCGECGAIEAGDFEMVIAEYREMVG